MGTVKQINIKNRTCYFYNDIIDIKNFDSSLLKLDKKSLVFTILDILQLKKLVIVKIFTLWILLGIMHANGYIEEINENKYLIFDFVDENNELLKKYNDVFNGIMDNIKGVSNDECDY